MTDEMRDKIFILTSNIATNGKLDDAFKKLAKDEAFAKRFKPIAIAPLSEAAIAQISGCLAAKQLGDDALTKEQERALGETLMEMIGPRDEKQGVRGVQKMIKAVLAEPLPPEAEDRLASCSPAFAAKTGQRRAERLAADFHRDIPVEPMKKLRLTPRQGA